MFMYYSPTKIVFGIGMLKILGEEVHRYGSKALLVTSRSFARKYGYLESLVNNMKSSDVEVYVYEGIEPNPLFELCESIAQKYRNKGIEVVIGFGGGSVIDAAKAIAVALSSGKRLRDLVYPNVIDFDVIPVIAIPTTCGTGSEVTKYSILTDLHTKRKVPLVGPSIIPRVAIVDPETLKHLPSELLIWTTFDAFTHALEGFTAKSSNPISDAIALGAMEIILDSINYIHEKTRNTLANLHIASTMGGLVINATGTTLIHAIGYYLTTHHNIHHGLANAIILPYVLKINLRGLPQSKITKLLQIFRASSTDELIKKLSRTLKHLDIPSNLAQVGIKESELSEMIKTILNYKRNLEVNPVPIDENLLKEILIEALKG